MKSRNDFLGLKVMALLETVDDIFHVKKKKNCFMNVWGLHQLWSAPPSFVKKSTLFSRMLKKEQENRSELSMYLSWFTSNLTPVG